MIIVRYSPVEQRERMDPRIFGADVDGIEARGNLKKGFCQVDLPLKEK